ncbi:MAG: glucose 1-dehydrogenase [Bradyrhizobium sp.]|uniref:glucose 1-dehydrogenase n=1 Tax=Bradyrhizobium sp. TaxID=376 RepID=UPI001DF32517|nr:glucose 1-dehydrogenase [Bradyrhizobium sp.]MBV9563638.1 glucose 1-dehydrogenase [Bradyrhizobium sp.]
MGRRFEKKVVLITGASGGIGRATALAFGEEGARVVVADIDHDGGRQTVSLIRTAGADASFVAADVSRNADCEGMVAHALSRFGRLDIAFNNAGIASPGFPIAEEEEIAWDRIIGVNLKGVFLSMKHEIPALLKSGGGAIVNTASVAGLVGTRALGSYCASKHGVVGLTRAAALDYIDRGIRINAICPGATRTPLLESWFQNPGVEKHIMQLHPIGRPADPVEMARAVLFLASGDASFMAGHAMPVDGGLTAQ